jgi:DNA-binding GntR family transcriptional regulator
LRILAGDGVVELTPNKGARLRVIDRERLIEMNQVLTGLFCIGIDLFTGRRQTDRAFAALRAIANHINQAAKGSGKYELHVTLIEYHQVILHFSGNSYLSYLFQRTHIGHYLNATDLAIDTSFLRELAQSYGEITDALEAGDAEHAKSILMSQLHQVEAYLKSTSPAIDEALIPLVKEGRLRKRAAPHRR